MIIFLMSFYFCLPGFPQNLHLIDSLENVVSVSKNDTVKIKLYYEIGQQYRNTIPDSAFYYFRKALAIAERTEEKRYITQCLIAIGANLQIKGSPDSAIVYLERALKLAEAVGDKEKMSVCYLNIGISNHDKGSYDKAIEYYLKSIETAQEINFARGLSRGYNNLGRAYFDQGSYDESIGSYLKALKIYEEIGSRRDMSACYNNIGLVHLEQRSYDKTIEYLEKALEIHKEFGDKRGMSICYLNIGNVYQQKDSSARAIEYLTRAMLLFKELGDKRGLPDTYHNLGAIYLDEGSYGKAREFYLKAMTIYEETGDKRSVALTGVGVANLNISMAESATLTESQRIDYLNQAVTYGNKSIVNAREMKLLPAMKEASNTLMKAYNKLGDYKKAIEFAGILITTQDSMFREDKTRAIQEMSTRYETEKKQQQIELQESQLIAKDARIKQQKTFRNALIGGLGAIVLVIIVIAYAYSQKQKDNRKIKEQNERIIKANEELKQLYEITSSQNEEIISSINYARRIQSAVLPSKTSISRLLKENFIFYKPKEIVSGDFYWIKQVRHYTILVSADCTGHGVPGAFMSMLGMSYLNEIVHKEEVTQANHILEELRNRIKYSLQQSGNKDEPRDGIDLALCVIDNWNNILQYAGANNPLYIIRKNNGESDLREFKADPMPVGVHSYDDKSFTNHEIKLEPGDALYIFSDGYIDQNGGDNNHRFTTSKFKRLLLEMHDKSMSEQKEILDLTLKNWMGAHSQRDDILVIGARV